MNKEEEKYTPLGIRCTERVPSGTQTRGYIDDRCCYVSISIYFLISCLFVGRKKSLCPRLLFLYYTCCCCCYLVDCLAVVGGCGCGVCGGIV